MFAEYSEGPITTALHKDGILEITLNRPKQLNALSHEILLILKTILLAARESEQVKALLIKGEGRGFSAGADITELALLNGANGAKYASFGQHVFHLLSTLGKPSLAVVHGFALGGGCELAMAATLRVAEENAEFAQPEIKLGLIPGFGGTQRLSRLIGVGRAMDLCLSGRRIHAQEALSVGLVNAVKNQAELFEFAIEYLRQIVTYSKEAINAILTAINISTEVSISEGLQLESALFGLACDSEEKTIAVKAFLEKLKQKKG